VNIHTDLHVSGEVRGNISESSTGLSAESEQTLWSRIKAMFE
jgi:hypothetical protein